MSHRVLCTPQVAKHPPSRGSRAGASKGRAYGTGWKGKNLIDLAKQGFQVVRALTLEAGGLAPADMEGLRRFAERAMALKQNLPRVHEANGQQTLCAPRATAVSTDPVTDADAVATTRRPPCPQDTPERLLEVRARCSGAEVASKGEHRAPRPDDP